MPVKLSGADTSAAVVALIHGVAAAALALNATRLNAYVVPGA